MSCRDWEDIINKLEEEIKKFQNSNEVFYPKRGLISARDLNKKNPGKWIPIYGKKDIPEVLHKERIYPIRGGKGSFFFYKGDIFFDLTELEVIKKEINEVKPKEKFFPLTLELEIEGNENAYLNKAYALGLINDFTEEEKKLLYGQFGKIKITKNLEFKTSKGKKLLESGLQFEIDLLLESSSTIYIFEAKLSIKPRKDFCLLQLYYPLIYVKSLLEGSNQKKTIKTVFVDIIKNKKNNEEYKFVSINFENLNFDKVFVEKAIIYH